MDVGVDSVPLLQQMLALAYPCEVKQIGMKHRLNLRAQEPQNGEAVINLQRRFLNDYTFLATFSLSQTRAHIAQGNFPRDDWVRKYHSVYCAETTVGAAQHRLVLIRAPDGTFVALAYFLNKQLDPTPYNKFLNNVEKLWYNLPQIAHVYEKYLV
jgi:hypothetical protein